MQRCAGLQQTLSCLRTEVTQPARLGWGLVILAICLGWLGSVKAATLSQGYKSGESLPAGTLVSLDNATTKSVKAATTATTQDLFGVVVKPAEVLVNLVNQTDQVQVATSGVALAFLSDINGSIKPGDRISTSAISGVGAKASDSTKILGIAQGSLNEGTSGSAKRTVKDRAGKDQTVVIARVPVAVEVAYYNSQGPVVGYARNLISGVAGREVSTQRALIGLGIMALALTLVGIMLSTSVKSSITSIGRNPLSKSAVQRSLLGVLMISVAVLVLAGVALYMVVR